MPRHTQLVAVVPRRLRDEVVDLAWRRRVSTSRIVEAALVDALPRLVQADLVACLAHPAEDAAPEVPALRLLLEKEPRP
jgi:hypothetical protein